MSHYTPDQYPQGGPQGPYYPPQPAPKPKRKKWPWVLGAIGAVVVISVAANAGGEDESSAPSNPAPAQDGAAPAAPPAPAAPAEPEGLPDNGTLRVGTDIQPGGYIVNLGDDPWMDDMGYWERLSCVTGDFSCVIANEIVQGPGYVEILPSDVAIKVQNVQLVPEG